MRPQAGVDRLKPVPPMHPNDLPVVGQALSPANRIISQLLSLQHSEIGLLHSQVFAAYDDFVRRAPWPWGPLWGRRPRRPARPQEEPDQGVRRGRGRPPHPFGCGSVAPWGIGRMNGWDTGIRTRRRRSRASSTPSCRPDIARRRVSTPPHRPCSVSRQSMARPCPISVPAVRKKMNFWPAGDNLWHSFSVFTVEAIPQL